MDSKQELPDVREMVRELADWDRQCFPLGGGDMMRLMIRFGFATAEEVEAIYREFMREKGEDIEWPPADHLDATGRWPEMPTSSFYKKHDDEIPF